MNPFIYVLSVNGLMFLISVIFYFFPPKKINSLYGYRTHRTMQNEDIWSFANGMFNKVLLKYAAISFVAAMGLAYAYPNLMTSWFPMAFLFFTLLVCILSTENALNEHFDKEGNRKTRK
ncbi:SdpI family protein [Pseudotenacibaculum haliotis]|uniref:SdpI family protein n=1 Tax=Pseudotenacibaculum haliotis TaxID=1862138 RepID=A0ABW5LR43_9FLAO